MQIQADLAEPFQVFVPEQRLVQPEAAGHEPERSPQRVLSESEDDEDAVPGTPPYDTLPAKRPRDGGSFDDGGSDCGERYF